MRALNISPTSAVVPTGGTQRFSATLSGPNDGVTWSVVESGGGAVSNVGEYIAPSTPGNFRVRVTSSADPTVFAEATVTVVSVSMAVAPVSATVTVGRTQQFTATVTGVSGTSGTIDTLTSSQAVIWSVQEISGGSVSATGLYTAPSTPGEYHVIATSSLDSTKTASATVTVTPDNGVSVAISPATATVAAGGTQQLTATVTGATNTAVDWTVQEGSAGGTVSASGLYTAPATAGTYHVMAISRADSGATAMSTLTVTPTVSVTLSPTTATVVQGKTQNFAATVTGTANTGVDYSVEEGASGGSVTSAGVYTAPATNGTFHVIAKSRADATKTARATVTVIAPVAVQVSPTTKALLFGGTQQFTATVTGAANIAVTWSVQEGNAGGTVNASGLYTAPSTAGTYHVIAKSVADTSKTATATVTVTPPVAVVIDPTLATVSVNGTQPFTATVTGASNTAVTWSVQEVGGGSVNSAGLYTAPNTPGTYHVVAKSVADTTKSATATVTVTASVAISISPTSSSVSTGQTQQFTTNVTGTANTAVTWSVEEGAAGGSVSGSGLYTAPATAGTYHVVVTSQADGTKSAKATVTVTAITVAVNPGTAEVEVDKTLSFSATVSGTANTGVTWSVEEGTAGGSISADGLYTAPATPGTFHVVATSDEAPTKQGRATVIVHPVITVALSPATYSMAATSSRTFTAMVTGATDASVSWSVEEGQAGGSVTAGGVYTAPATPGTYHLVATSNEFSQRTGSATITVTEFAPITVGLVAHFAADQLLGAGVPLPADGASVTSWADISGLSRNLSVTTTPPVFKLNALNGKPAVVFDGVDDRIATSAYSPAYAQPTTIVILYKGPPTGASNTTVFDAPSTAGASRNRIQITQSPNPGGVQMYAGQFQSVGPAKASGAFHYVVAQFNGATSLQRVNGVEELKNLNVGAGGLGGIQLGGRQELTAGAFCQTEVPEVLAYNRALTATEIAQVENYVRAKYGLQQ